MGERGRVGKTGREVGVRGREVGNAYPPVHPLFLITFSERKPLVLAGDDLFVLNDE